MCCTLALKTCFRQSSAKPSLDQILNLCTRNLQYAFARSRSGLLRAVSVNSTSQPSSPSKAVLQWQTTSQDSPHLHLLPAQEVLQEPGQVQPAHHLQPSTCLSALHWAGSRAAFLFYTGQQIRASPSLGPGTRGTA